MNKEQPDKTVFRNFITATADLLACEATPKALREAIDDAITNAGNELKAYDEYADVNARRVLSRIFGLSEEEEGKPTSPALTLEQARDQVTEAVTEMLSHPDVTPGVINFVSAFTTVLLHKLDEQKAQPRA